MLRTLRWAAGWFAAAALSVLAADPATPKLTVTPDHADWKYALGERVTFQVRWDGGAVPANGVSIRYRVGPETAESSETSAVLGRDGLRIDGGTMTRPGFLRCLVTAEWGGATLRGLATAGFAPERIEPTQTEPADFDAFWAAAKAELAAVPLDPQMTLLADQSTATVDVYHVSFQNVGVVGATFPSPRTRIYGMLCVPKSPGLHPAMLRLPGATVRAYPGVRDLAAKGIITLEIGIHGIPVNLGPEIYQQLVSGVLASYPTYQLDHPRAYYYRRVYLGCVRANDFLCSLSQWDRKTLLVSGHSQGGQLTVATAVLDPRVNAVAVTFPAFCDVTGYLHGRAGGWPHMFRDERNGHRTPAKIATTGYYDTVNFARRLQVPGFYTWGFNDETCPPTSMFAAYNVITAPKTLFVALETGHAASREQLARVSGWLVERSGRSASASR